MGAAADGVPDMDIALLKGKGRELPGRYRTPVKGSIRHLT